MRCEPNLLCLLIYNPIIGARLQFYSVGEVGDYIIGLNSGEIVAVFQQLNETATFQL